MGRLKGGACVSTLNQRCPWAYARLQRSTRCKADARGAGVTTGEDWSSFTHVKRVGIIGAGVAGLQTAKALASHGFETKVFDQAPDVGGVWRSNYANFGLQVPKQQYEFYDFPFTSADPGEFSSGVKVQQYIKQYSAANKLADKIALGTRVARLERRAGGERGWTFVTESVASGAVAREEFDFAVVCSGMFNEPSMPPLPGAQDFAGVITHSSTFTDTSQASRKIVVVIGYGKSAIDCAIESSYVAAQTTLLYRQPYWPVPRKVAWLIPYQFIFTSRFGQALVSGYKGAWPTAPEHMHTLHKVFSPVMGLVFGLVQALFALQLGLRPDQIPEADIVTDFYKVPFIISPSLQEQVAAGKVVLQRGAVSHLTKDSVVLADGTSLPCDVLVCGTGFQRTYAYLDDVTQALLGVESDGMYLYRHCVPPAVPDLAFCGSELSTGNNVLTHGIMALWLVGVLTGRVKLPCRADMEAAVERHKTWARSWIPESRARASQVLLHAIHFHDTLLQDLGIPHLRKPNFLEEAFAPYESTDYAGISLKP